MTVLISLVRFFGNVSLTNRVKKWTKVWYSKYWKVRKVVNLFLVQFLRSFGAVRAFGSLGSSPRFGSNGPSLDASRSRAGIPGRGSSSAAPEWSSRSGAPGPTDSDRRLPEKRANQTTLFGKPNRKLRYKNPTWVMCIKVLCVLSFVTPLALKLPQLKRKSGQNCTCVCRWVVGGEKWLLLQYKYTGQQISVGLFGLEKKMNLSLA